MPSIMLRVITLSVLITLLLTLACWAFHVSLPGYLMAVIFVGSYLFSSWLSHRQAS
jgi:hypothetical protein